MAKWKPGESGNPAGRPKGAKDKKKEEIRKLIREEVDFSRLVIAMEKKARNGSEPAARLLLEYAFGKPQTGEGMDTLERISHEDLIRSAQQSLALVADDKLQDELVKRLHLDGQGVRNAYGPTSGNTEHS